ncbi:MAG: hypothetical protein DWQ10_13550 [Calditrichaeota bacterium]|nr:MAG: hypothetical protein DWQ10_13550 [Calditrichota bacterium]
MKRIWQINLLFTFLFALLFSSELRSMPVNAETDSLRKAIHILQAKLDSLNLSRSARMNEFGVVNSQINDLKLNLSKNQQPLLEFRLKAAMKNSRELADNIAGIDRKINETKSMLQNCFNTAISALDDEIQHLLQQGESSQLKSKKLGRVQYLSREKSNYLEQLNSIKINVSEWQNIKPEPGDSEQRMRMKLDILEDKAAKLERAILQRDGRLQEHQKDYKMQKELLSFYLDLSRTVEEEEGIIDRNRIDEINDHAASLAKRIEGLAAELAENRLNLVHLQAKIEQFRTKIVEMNK